METEKRKAMSRRQWLTAGAAAAAAPLAAGSAMGQAVGQAGGQAAGQPAAPPQIGPVVVGNYAPSDTLVMGGIGLRGRGQSDLKQLLGNEEVKFVAIADIREDARESVKSIVDGYYKNNNCVMYRDAGELLARTDIDALLIATSDRWHAHMACWAAQSGKDMYEEKPAAMSIAEAYALMDNCKRYGVVYQSGCQRRNQYAFEFAVGLARSGKLGRLLSVHADCSIGGGPTDALGHSWLPEEPEPEPLVFDYDKWLGPVGWHPYNKAYINTSKNDFWDFHAGLLEWASHTVAMAQWAADMEYTVPVEYAPSFDPAYGQMTPGGIRGEFTCTCRYANGVQLILRNHGWRGLGSCSNRFEGTEGWVETGDSGRIEVSENLKSLLPARKGRRYDPTAEHIREFLHAVRGRVQPRANAEVTAYTHIASHCAYIACQLNRKLTWDHAKRAFIGDEEANRMRSRAHREPWRMEALSTSM